MAALLLALAVGALARVDDAPESSKSMIKDGLVDGGRRLQNDAHVGWGCNVYTSETVNLDACSSITFQYPGGGVVDVYCDSVFVPDAVKNSLHFVGRSLFAYGDPCPGSMVPADQAACGMVASPQCAGPVGTYTQYQGECESIGGQLVGRCFRNVNGQIIYQTSPCTTPNADPDYQGVCMMAPPDPTVKPTADPTAKPTADPTAKPTADPTPPLLTLDEKRQCFVAGGGCSACCRECAEVTPATAGFSAFLAFSEPYVPTAFAGACACLDLGGEYGAGGAGAVMLTDGDDCLRLRGNSNLAIGWGGRDVIVSLGDDSILLGGNGTDHLFANGTSNIVWGDTPGEEATGDAVGRYSSFGDDVLVVAGAGNLMVGGPAASNAYCKDPWGDAIADCNHDRDVCVDLSGGDAHYSYGCEVCLLGDASVDCPYFPTD